MALQGLIPKRVNNIAREVGVVLWSRGTVKEGGSLDRLQLPARSCSVARSWRASLRAASKSFRICSCLRWLARSASSDVPRTWRSCSMWQSRSAVAMQSLSSSESIA